MRTGAPPGPAFNVEDKRGISPGSSSSSSSRIVSSLIRLESFMDFGRGFREVDEDVPSILCFLIDGLGSSSAEACLVPRRFRFPRDGSSTTREVFFDVRESTGESVAWLLDVNEFRELLEFRLASLLGVGVTDARDPLCFLEAGATVNILPKRERAKHTSTVTFLLGDLLCFPSFDEILSHLCLPSPARRPGSARVRIDAIPVDQVVMLPLAEDFNSGPVPIVARLSPPYLIAVDGCSHLVVAVDWLGTGPDAG